MALADRHGVEPTVRNAHDPKRRRHRDGAGPSFLRHQPHQHDGPGPGRIAAFLPGHGGPEAAGPGFFVDPDGILVQFEEPEIWKLRQQVALKGSPLAHARDDLEIAKPLHQIADAGEMVLEHLDLGIVR